jgi:(1->4)-alpha-D-glucan 1-alpha-D-glucosylmutase
MTTLSTHDTKRGEDLRARLAVLAERPGEWAAEVARWHDRAVTLGAGGAGCGGAGTGGTGTGGAGGLPEPDTEYLLWQTLAGAWPVDASRLTRYLCKAMREAKTATSWTDPDDAYEAAALALAEAVLADTGGGPARTGGGPVGTAGGPARTAGTSADAGLAARIAAFVAGIDSDARVGSLGAKLVQLTMPGVPDVYQGCELGSFSLVDPDNRRPVDFARRRDLLALLDTTVLDDAGGLDVAGLAVTDLDWQKLLVTSRALRLRRDHPDWFTGSYEPLTAKGLAADHVVAFARSGQVVTVATRLPAGLRRRGGWADTVLPMPSRPGAQPRAWRDVLTETVHAGPDLVLSRLTERLPVALLVPEPVAKRPGQVF